jgi:large subunit ribosomal protein L29
MKAREIRDLSPEERQQKLTDLKEELFNLRFQHAVGQIENPKKLKKNEKRYRPNKNHHTRNTTTKSRIGNIGCYEKARNKEATGRDGRK